MRKISIDDIVPDSIVAAAVTSPSGNVLLNKGASITPTVGRRLRNWGITHVFIEGEGGSEHQIKVEAQSPEEIRSGLHDIFSGTLDNARMQKVFDAVCAHKIQKQDKAQLCNHQ